MLKANFWLIAMACGCFQALQAMSNGSAVRSGIGAIWVGALSATISALTLVLVAVAIYRLPLPDTSLPPFPLSDLSSPSPDRTWSWLKG